MTVAEQWIKDSVVLFTLPEVYLRLQKVLNDDTSSMQQVADVLAFDPALTTKLLRLVNSAFFGFGQKIETISHAVSMLGTQQVHDLALATSVTSRFSDIPDNLVNMSQFWHKSIHCGVLARLLASRCNVLDSERLFVAGLLHEIGHLLMYQKAAEKMQQVLKRSKTEARPLYLLEQELTGTDYAKVGAELMSSWGLPESLIITTRFHLQPTQAPEYELQTAIIHIAAVIAGTYQERLLSASKTDAKTELEVNPLAWQLTGLTAEAIEPLCKEAEQQLAQTESLLFPGESVSA